MKLRPASFSAPLVEPLEARIAPALTGVFSTAVVNSAILLDADPSTPAPQGLSASEDGPFLIYVQSGSALVFTKDLNLNNRVDFNEITGISAGANLSLISFVDIHGDIVTNLNADGTLTDSDSDAANGRDGRVLLGSRINKIELRSVTADDLPATEPVSDKIALSTYSIFGNIYAGGGFGTADGTGGLRIDDSGKTDQALEFTGDTGFTLYRDAPIHIGSIRVGTAASGQQFGFGASPTGGVSSGVPGADVRGTLQEFIQAPNTRGADINGVRAINPTTFFSIDTLQAGDGGFNGAGGNVANVQINGDASGGYSIIAGNAGDGPTGPVGGSILNFSDLGSIGGGRIYLKTGDGGNGLLKRGGDGGSLTLDPAAPVNAAGNIVVKLGDGGNGATGGGSGGSQLGGSFITPETVVPTGLTIISSWHQPGDIGNQISDIAPGTLGYHATRGFDFDLDGINDAVYSTNDSDQLVVMFGDGFGGFRPPSENVYLPNLATASAITIGDFNDDGRPDIASASGDFSFAGVQVFISRYDATTGVFVGFADPIYSALPSVGGHLSAGGGFITAGVQNQQASRAFEMASGDFNNDGTVDIAVITNLGLYILKGDAQLEPNPAGGAPIMKASGYFYSDVGATALDPATGLHIIPAAPHIDSNVSTLRPTALTDGGPDYLFAADEGEAFNENGFVTLINYTGGGGLGGGGVQLGTVDDNRAYPQGTTTNITNPPPKVTPRDFVVLDVNDDGDADLVVLSVQPTGFLVTFQGNGTPGSFLGATTKTSNRELDGQNDGIYIGDGTVGPYDVGNLERGSLIGLMAANTDGDPLGSANDIVVMEHNTKGQGIKITEFSFGVDPGLPPPANPNYIAPILGQSFQTADVALGLTFPPLIGDNSIRAFDTYVPVAAAPANVTYTYLQAFRDDPDFDFVETFRVGGVGGFIDSLEDNTFFFTAGHGGDSSNGPGGAGGKLGNALKIVNGRPVGSLNYTFPVQEAYEGLVRFVGGDGGNGFTAGGAGGGISGVSVDYAVGATVLTGAVSVFSGEGGDSTIGRAGKGGDLSSFSIATGFYFSAGNGGNGKFGGDGGSVLGNPNALVDITVSPGNGFTTGSPGDIENSQTAFLVVKSGTGGTGTKGGGNGGAISGLTPRFLPLIGGAGGLLHFEAGDGGSSVGGAGGRGGSVINNSPVSDDNNLSGDVFITAGDGGSGKTGGAGGSISNFKNSASPDISPTSLTFIAGNGGLGIAGRGGVGGNLSEVSISGTGIGTRYYFNFSNPERIFRLGDAQFDDFGNFLTPADLTYSRFAAGNGGDSLGNAGGVGGNLSNVIITSTSSPIAAIAGKGGDGLTLGGAGGSVISSTVNAAGPTGKILVAAGDGGDGIGGLPTPANPLGFGGKNATGGKGGSITNYLQNVGTEVNVDLIAGNGGNTPNSGSSLAVKTNVGNGGSITNAQVIGNIGRGALPSDEMVAIKSYNDLLGGQNFADFVAAFITADPGIGGVLPLLTDAVGNVGIVVGAHGRVKDNNSDGVLDPSTSGLNGSLTNVHAKSIMSAVAGSVQRIASIRALSNVGVTVTGGAYGSDKGIDYLGRVMAPGNATPYHDSDAPALLDYLITGAIGNPADDLWTNVPPDGGILVDGAIIADTARPPKSARDF